VHAVFDAAALQLIMSACNHHAHALMTALTEGRHQGALCGKVAQTNTEQYVQKEPAARLMRVTHARATCVLGCLRTMHSLSSQMHTSQYVG
jgi:hypothetical protein